MNVYDFDQTIYVRDSTVDFYLFCLRRYPSICRFIPGQLFGALLLALGFADKTAFKQRFFAYYRGIPHLEALVPVFWDSHEAGIKDWYKRQHRPDDVIISASPEFLLRPICTRLGIKYLLGSRVDPESGVYTGKNCDGREKVRRFREAFPQGEIDCFYSDSLSDTPLARIARESYAVRGDKLISWAEYESAKKR